MYQYVPTPTIHKRQRLGKVFAYNSGDYQPIIRQIRQTYAHSPIFAVCWHRKSGPICLLRTLDFEKAQACAVALVLRKVASLASVKYITFK